MVLCSVYTLDLFVDILLLLIIIIIIIIIIIYGFDEPHNVFEVHYLMKTIYVLDETSFFRSQHNAELRI